MTMYRMVIKEKGMIRSCRSFIAKVLIDPNVLNIPTFNAGNKNVTQKIKKIKLRCPSSLSGSNAAGKVNVSKAKRYVANNNG